jgi:iron complex transport system ATP-binding protein
LGLADQYADDILLLSEGRSLVQGGPAEVLTPERLEEVYGMKALRGETGLTLAPLPDAAPQT